MDKLKEKAEDLDETQAEIERLKLELAESRLRIRLLGDVKKKEVRQKELSDNTSSDC